MKDFVVSDIHDHFDLLMEALNQNDFDINNENHRLIICGDAFYSGPQPGELFAFLRKLSEKGRLIFIYGNHDIELLDNLVALFKELLAQRCRMNMHVEYAILHFHFASELHNHIAHQFRPNLRDLAFEQSSLCLCTADELG